MVPKYCSRGNRSSTAETSSRRNGQPPQGLHHRAGKPLHSQPLGVAGVGDEGIIQIAQIVVHSTAAGGPPHHMDTMGLHKGPVDLGLGILVLPYHNGIVVLPQHQIVSLGPPPQHRLLKGQVIGGIQRAGLQVMNLRAHCALLSKIDLVPHYTRLHCRRQPPMQNTRCQRAPRV